MNDERVSGGDIIAALDHLRTGMAIFDAEDVLIYCNEHFRYVYPSLEDIEGVRGWTYEQILRHLIKNGEFAGRQAVVEPEAWIADRLANHRKSFAVTTERLATGNWVEVKERRLEDGRTISIWSDSTERSRYTARLRGAMDCVADGFAIWDQVGRLVNFNHRLINYFDIGEPALCRGQTRTEVFSRLAESGTIVFEGEAADWVGGIMKKALGAAYEISIEFSDDRHVILAERRTGDGGIVSALTDITELKHNERELVFRGHSLQYANEELEMVNSSLERQGEELVGMAEQLDETLMELQRRDEALALIEARQRSILNTMADALIVLDMNGHIETLNPASEGILGLNGEAAEGCRLIDFIQIVADGELVGDIPAYFSILYAGLEQTGNPAPRHIELTIRRRDGSSLPVEMAIARTEVGQNLFYVTTMRDISERKTAEQALRESHELLEQRVEKRTRALSIEIEHRKKTEHDLLDAKVVAEHSSWAKSQFLANMSHELRTPLNAIIGFSEMLEGEYFGPLGDKRYHGYSEHIHNSGLLLLELIGDILDVSKIELGAVDLDEDLIDVPQTTQTCVTMIKDQAGRNRINLSVMDFDPLPLLRGDKRRVKQVLLNVMTNAVKFTPANGDIVISHRLMDSGGIKISVRDTGIGISERDINRVLQPFAQVADSQTRDYEGAGLGLSICKALIEAHGGRFELSSALGEGTSVDIIFPRERTVLDDDG